MASTSRNIPAPIEEGRIYLDVGSLCFAKTNSRVQEVDKDNPTNRRGYTFLRFCEDETWTAKKCKGVYEYLDADGYNWYALCHDRTNGRPYLGKQVPQVDQYNTQIDKYDFPPPRTAEQIAADKEKQVEYLTDYDSNPQPTKEAHSTDYESDSTNPRETKETHSTDEELNKETSFDASVIRNSPIGTRPKLTPTILTVMSTTTTQPTITVQTATTTATTSGTTVAPAAAAATGGTTLTATQQITTAINKALRRNPGSGPGGPGGPAPQGINPLAVIPQAADVRLMGSLPAIFSGNRAEAEHFINGIQAYIRLNREVSGFNSPMKKIALVLTLMQGDKVADWANDIGEALDELNPATDNIPALWTTFLEEFREQYLDTQAADRARTELESLIMKIPYIDEDISKFEDLCHKSNYMTGNSEVTYMFLKGLPKSLLEDVLKAPQAVDYPALKE